VQKESERWITKGKNIYWRIRKKKKISIDKLHAIAAHEKKSQIHRMHNTQSSDVGIRTQMYRVTKMRRDDSMQGWEKYSYDEVSTVDSPAY
jgi:hypothetical protein